MKIDNDGKPQYGPRPRGQKKQSSDGGDWLFWLGVGVLVVIVLVAL